ncbi:MAG: response regulator transcription factor [Flavobacteriales bacterium]|nr:response regulator transcription factor [Flavobacteriales bacterium]
MNAYIIEDEAKSMLYLSDLLRTNHPEINIVGYADKLGDAASDLQQLKVDILFCDIKVQGLNSINFLETLELVKTNIIFTTAYKDFAIRAFRLNAVDYLLKPIDPDELREAINRVKIEKDANPEEGSEKDENALKDKLIISETGSKIIIKVEDILYLMASGTYTKIHLVDGACHISSKNLRHYELCLKDNHFFRIHHGTLVQLGKVKQFETKKNELILENGDALVVSYRKKPAFIEALSKFGLR